MVRNAPIQVWQNSDSGSIKTKQGQHVPLRYVAGHHSTLQQNKVDPRWPQMLANIFKCPNSTRLELVYTFCEFLAEFLRINNQTLQKTCIKLFVHIFTFQKCAENPRKIMKNSNIFLKCSQIITHSDNKQTSEIRIQTASCWPL